MSDGIEIDGWLDRKATAKFCNVTEWWLEKHCHNTAIAPRYIRHGRKTWYRFDDLRAWKLNEEVQAQVRAASGQTLGAVFNIQHRRKAETPPPPAADLLERYNNEHGPGDLVISRRFWEELKATFTHAQRKLVRHRLQAIP